MFRLSGTGSAGATVRSGVAVYTMVDEQGFCMHAQVLVCMQSECTLGLLESIFVTANYVLEDTSFQTNQHLLHRRLYVEQYTDDKSKYGQDAQEALADIIQTALKVSKLPELTGRDKPTVIT